MDFLNDIEAYLVSFTKSLKSIDKEQINNAINVILDTYCRDGFIYVLGNGGSLSTASHMASDFNKYTSENLSKKFKFLCMADNIPTFSAISNDLDYSLVFRKSLENFLSKKDLVICISGSGNSENLIKAIEYTKIIGADTLSIVGFDGGKLKKLSKYCVHFPVNDMQISEDLHMLISHLMSRAVKLHLERTISL